MEEEDNIEKENFESESKELTPREIAFRVFRGLIALVAIFGLLYLSGIYQSSFYRRTPLGIKEENLESRLDAENISLPLTIFILANDDSYGSRRTRREARELVENASRIWQQASIQFQVKKLTVLLTRDDELTVFLENPRAFLREFEKYDPEAINVFLLRSLGGINGVAFGSLRSVAVADYTTVYDFRALAHEVGHVLGLEHVPVDRGRLMYKGANGFEFSLEEIMRARDSAIRF